MVMAWIHAEWAWNLKGKDSVAQASDLIHLEVAVAVVAAEATAVTVEMVPRLAAVAVVEATAAMVEVVTRVE